VLADRALSLLLHGDWPKSTEEMEKKKQKQKRVLAEYNKK
jgi:hypothetical protein